MAETDLLHPLQRLLAERYALLDELLDGATTEMLLWKPFDRSPWRSSEGDYGCNSLGEIVAHAVSSTVYLLRRAQWVVGRLPWEAVDGDQGPVEFGPADYDPAALRVRVQRTHEMAREILATLTPAELTASRWQEAWGRDLHAGYDVFHALDHLAQHIGHAQLTRQLAAIALAGVGPRAAETGEG